MLLQEIRHGVRALLRIPSLTVISILTVALGVGAGASLFSVVKAVLLEHDNRHRLAADELRRQARNYRDTDETNAERLKL